MKGKFSRRQQTKDCGKDTTSLNQGENQLKKEKIRNRQSEIKCQESLHSRESQEENFRERMASRIEGKREVKTMRWPGNMETTDYLRSIILTE